MIAINTSLDAPGLDDSASRPTTLGDQVATQLRENPFPTLKRIRCEVQEDIVVLRGRLPSYFLKQMAQTLCGQVLGVRSVRNEIEVTE